MNQIATSQSPLADAAMPVIVDFDLPTASFWLGVAHLRNGGLNQGWLLRECVQRHISAVAASLSLRPSDLRSVDGERVHVTINSCVVSGDLGDFAEDDEVTLDMVVRPRTDTGWRSLITLRSIAGAELKVEIVSGFAKRAEGSCALSPAEMPERHRVKRDDPAAHRANCLVSRGCSWRATAEFGSREATFSTTICAPVHMNGCGCIDSGALVDCIEQSEHIALAARRRQTPMLRRELHLFDTIEDGDRLDIQSQSYVCEGEHGDQIAVKSVLRRASDNAVIGVSETLRKPGA